MKGLRELVEFVYNQNLTTEAFTPGERVLFDRVVNDDELDDEQTQHLLCGEKKDCVSYRLSKKSLKDRLINALLFTTIEREHCTEYFVEKNWCYRRNYVVFLMFSLNLKESGVALAEHVLAKALKYDFTEIAHSCARFLVRHYGANGDHKSFKEAAGIYRHCADVLRAEAESELLLNEITICFARSAAPQQEKWGRFNRSLERLKELRTLNRNHQLTMNYLRGGLVLAQARQDHESVLAITNEGLAYLKEHPHLAQRKHYFEFYNARVNSFSTIGDYNNARFSIKLALNYITSQNQLWFIYQKRRFILALHTGNFDDAHNVIQGVLSSKAFDKQSKIFRQQWKLFTAYMRYVEMRQDYSEPNNEKRKVERLLAETSDVKQDKAGWNISLLIIQILFYIKWSDLDKLEVRYEALQKYCSKYLYKNHTYRSQVFIRMLLLIPRESGDYERVEKLGRQWLRKLEASEYKLDECEIIPYERLWTWVLTDLRTDIPNRSRYAYEMDVAVAPELGYGYAIP